MKLSAWIIAMALAFSAVPQSVHAQPQRRGRIIIRPQVPPDPGPRGRYIDVEYPTPEKRAANLAELLGLTEDQKQKVLAIFSEQDKQTMALWSDQSLTADARSKKIDEVRAATMKKVRELLTDAQKAKYDAVGAEEKPAGK
jgi:Spy/CpxP family protein refolding chaperone